MQWNQREGRIEEDRPAKERLQTRALNNSIPKMFYPALQQELQPLSELFQARAVSIPIV